MLRRKCSAAMKTRHFVIHSIGICGNPFILGLIRRGIPPSAEKKTRGDWSGREKLGLFLHLEKAAVKKVGKPYSKEHSRPHGVASREEKQRGRGHQASKSPLRAVLLHLRDSLGSGTSRMKVILIGRSPPHRD